MSSEVISFATHYPNLCVESELDARICLAYQCEYMYNWGIWRQISNAFNHNNLYTAYVFLGSSVGLIFFLFVYNTEKLQVHPMRLIMYLVLLESSFQIILAQNFYICDWKQNELLSYTLWFSATDEEVLAATYLLIYSANFLACFCV